MWSLALSSAFFLTIHLMISGTILKQQMIQAIGTRTYMLLFSIFSIVGFMWMVLSYSPATLDPQNIIYFSHDFKKSIYGTAIRFCVFPLNFIGWNLIVLGMLSKSPTKLSAVKQLPEKSIFGIIRLTRHPILIGISIMCISHMISNGELAGLIFFGALGSLCVLGAHSIDHKRLEQYGEPYEKIMRLTSIMPGAAIAAGRTAFEPNEIGVLRVALSVSSFTSIVVLHEILFGAPAL